MRTGLTLETEVFDRLATKHGWEIEKNEVLDLYHGIDRVIRGRHGRLLRVPGAAQVTLKGGDADKLEAYIKSCKNFPDWAHFYSIIARDMEEDEAADQLSEVFETYLIYTAAKPSVTGVFLCKGKTWKPFDIEQRIAKLRERANPAVTAAIRKHGKIHRLTPNGFSVHCADDKQIYAAFDADAADRQLRGYLKNYRQFDGPSPIGLVVNFIAHEDEAQRKRALSVVYQLRARNP